MSVAKYSKFNQFKNPIQALPISFTEEALLSEQFLLEKDEKKKLEIYYAPFEYVNNQAKVVIVGITPGLFQMKQSYSTVLNFKDQPEIDEKILSQVKNNSSFDGPMRKNLIQMLDKIGLHKHLNLSSSLELFNEASHLVHTTSAITYPVFHKGDNYDGSVPNILKTELLRKYVTGQFITELKEIDNPVIIPLGVKVSNVLKYLVDEHLLDSNRILFGFPHPSGQNGWRTRQFATNKESMIQTLELQFQSNPLIIS